MGKSSRRSAGTRDYAHYFYQEPEASGHKNQNAKENPKEAGCGGVGRRPAPCDVTPPKETTARRMPMPMVISAGFQNAFPGARTGSKSDSSGGVAITEMGSIAEVVLMTKKS